MRQLPPNLAPAGYSPRRVNPLSPAPVSDQGQRLTDVMAIQRLFANGEQGGYWPADSAYLFEDSSGTTPASVNGVVGLWYGIGFNGLFGAELIVNGGFDSDTTWLKGTNCTISGGVGVFASAPNLNAIQKNMPFLIEGNYYICEFDIIEITEGGLRAYIGVGIGSAVSSVRRARFFGKSSSYKYVGVVTSEETSAIIDNLSLRMLKAPPALQATTANKPYLRRTPVSNKLWLDSNTATGALTATFASSLGSACTIASVGAEGVTIADNQTVGTTYNLCPPYGYNGDVLIINRALTVAEKALVTRVMGRNVPIVSQNLVRNGSFDTDSDLILSGNWSVSGGLLSHLTSDSSSINARLLLSKSLTTAVSYYITLDLISRTAGNCQVGIGGFVYHVVGTVPGSYKIMRSPSGSTYSFYVNNNLGNFLGSVDNVMVREIL